MGDHRQTDLHPVLEWGTASTYHTTRAQRQLATIDLAPGYSKYAEFCAHATIGDNKDDADPVIAMPATTTSFDNETDDNGGHALEEDDENSLAPEREEENEHGVDEQEPNSPEEKDETKPT